MIVPAEVHALVTFGLCLLMAIVPIRLHYWVIAVGIAIVLWLVIAEPEDRKEYSNGSQKTELLTN